MSFTLEKALKYPWISFCNFVWALFQCSKHYNICWEAVRSCLKGVVLTGGWKLSVSCIRRGNTLWHEKSYQLHDWPKKLLTVLYDNENRKSSSINNRIDVKLKWNGYCITGWLHTPQKTYEHNFDCNSPMFDLPCCFCGIQSTEFDQCFK